MNWLSAMIGGSYTTVLVRACDDIIIIIIITRNDMLIYHDI